MHDGLQLGTLVLVLFGILLNRYDFNTVRKELRTEIADMRKDFEGKLENLRNEFLRRTDAIVATQFNHAERIATLETRTNMK